jgi:uncharacterized protein
MKFIKPLVIATSIFIITVVGLAIISTSRSHSTVVAQAPTPSPFEPVRSVTVTGIGQVRVIPDEAVIVIGVETQAETAREAVNQNNQQMQTVLSALQEAGVAVTDIQTRTLNLFPRYGDERPVNGRLADIVGYTARNQVEARVRTIDTVGDIVDAAIMAGANTIEGIRFEVSDPTLVLDQARQEAMDDARRKAEQLAEMANASLGNVLTISEFSRAPRPVVQEAVAMDFAATPIEPGTETLEVEVQVSWFIQ